MAHQTTSSRTVPTRRISFEASLQDLPKHFAADGDLIASHLAALSSVFPDGEDYFVRSVRHFRSEITDPQLKRQVAGFIGQEAMHGREHRALNDRLAALGYPVKRYERITYRFLKIRERLLSPKSNLAATAALEHFTATLAELVLSSDETRRLFGREQLRNIFVWHALEECEHKAVAFDVYQAVGGTNRMRVWTMNAIRYIFVTAMTLMVIGSLLGDRETYRRGVLRQSWKRFKRSPLMRRDVWLQLKDYNRPDFHPDDSDTDALLDRWRTELFGEYGTLNDKLVAAGGRGVTMEREHLDVVIVGAGLSGIGAGCYLKTKRPWARYAVFESRDAIGGTWDIFRYPGIRSDSDMYTLGYSFRPWDGAKTLADGESILRYIKDTAAEYGVDETIRFHHRIVAADWSTADGRWNVTAQRTETGEVIELTAGFVFSCSGYYRYDKGYQPDFAGIEDFLGTIVHPQQWPEDLDYVDKKVVVIGSGATAVTLIPLLSEKAEHVTMLQRSPTYIASVPTKNPLVGLLRMVLPKRVSGRTIRWVLALATQGFFQLSRRRPKFVKKMLRRGLERQLPMGYDIDTHFTPKYNPWDQRLCVAPDGDLFKAIKAGTASVVTDHIVRFTEKGLALQSGAHLDADIVISATGLELLFIGGIKLSVDGADVDVAQLLTYKGMMLEGVPNFALAVGYTNASWTLKCDLTCDYVCRLLNRLHETGLRQCTPLNADANVTASPLLGLSSGYIQRAQDRFPKQGSKFPWRVKQSYVADYRALKMKGIDDDAMVFSNSVPPALEPVAIAGS